MSYGIRFIGLAVVVLAVCFVESMPGVRLQAQEIEGESMIFDLSHLEKDDGVKKSAVRYQKALTELQKVDKLGRSKVEDALKEFESRPSRKNESLLIKAQIEAISMQFHAHKEFQAAAKEAGKAIVLIIGEMRKGSEIICEQVEALNKEKAGSLKKATAAQVELEALAERLPELVDDKGNLDPELEAVVRRLDSIRVQALDMANDVDVVKEDVEYDLERLKSQLRDLHRKKNNLKDSETASTIRLDRLSWMSGNLDRAVRNRQLLDSARSLTDLIPLDKLSLSRPEYPLFPRRGAKGATAKGKESSSAPQKGLELLKRLKKVKAAREEASPRSKAPVGKSAKSPSSLSQARLEPLKIGGKVE